MKIPKVTLREAIAPTISDPRMTLRDYFAAQIVPAVYREVIDSTLKWITVREAIASMAYEIADAMLEHKAKLERDEARREREAAAALERDAAPAPEPFPYPKED